MSSSQARITRLNETRSVEFDLVICACQRDVIRHFGSSFCYNDKFIIYPSNVIKNFEINILNHLFNIYLLKKIHILKRISLYFLCVLNPEQGLELKIILIA